MATTITASDVVSQFGAFYIDQGQNDMNIHDTLREQFVDTGDFTVIDTEDTVLRESNVEYSEVLQAFQTGYTPKGGVTFKPKAIPLFNVKVDQLFYPDVLKNSWLQFLLSNNLDRTTWPFVRWFIEKYVMGQIGADMVKNLYGAIRVEPTAGTAGTAAQAFNGLKKIMDDAVTAGTMTPIVTGAPSATALTWCNQIETFAQGVDELYWNQAMGIQMSRTLALRYTQGRRTKYNTYYMQEPENKLFIEDFEDMTINGRGSMKGSSRIWTTLKTNAIMGFKGGANRSIVEVEKVDRQVKVYTDFWVGLGFINDSLVWINDQA